MSKDITLESTRGADMAQREAEYEHCKEIADNKNILELLVTRLEKNGLVGEDSNAKIIYLASVTHNFDRPSSIVIKGDSSSGKSYLLEKVLEVIDPESIHRVSSLTDKSIQYSVENMRHKHLAIGEMSGVNPQTGMTFLRQIMSEGKATHWTVDSSEGKLNGREIVVEGPLGILMTTTATNLHNEDDTRFLSLKLDNSPEQRQRILLAGAKAQNRGTNDNADNKDWHAFDRWVSSGTKNVSIPYAELLVEQIDPKKFRISRDMGQVYSLIKASALVHQNNRHKVDNVIEASIEDYQNVYPLLDPVFSRIYSQATDGSGQLIMDTLAQLHEFDPERAILQKDIAQAAGIDESTVSRLVPKLQERVMIEISKASDGRGNILTPVSAGQSFLPHPDTISA